GVPDEKYGEEVLACVILREGAKTLTRDELARFCRGRLAHYKVPRYLRLMDAFPMTVSGKVRKVELREAAARELLPETRSEADPAARTEASVARAEPQAARN
ncbi:AMP-binding enzyme, partial [Streptomyces milbemycinicus]